MLLTAASAVAGIAAGTAAGAPGGSCAGCVAGAGRAIGCAFGAQATNSNSVLSTTNTMLAFMTITIPLVFLRFMPWH